MKKIYHILDRKRKLSFYYLIVLMFIATIAEILGVGLIIPLLYSISDQNFFEKYTFLEEFNRILGYPNNNELVVISLFFLVFIYISKNIFLTFTLWEQGKFVAYNQENISKRLFASYLNKDFSFHLKHNSANFVARIRNDVGYFSNSVNALIILISETLIIVGISFLLIFFEPLGFTITATIIIIMSLVFYFFSSRKLSQLADERQKSETIRIKKLQEGFGGIKEIKTFGNERYFLEKYFSLAGSLARVYHFKEVIQKFPRIYFETIAIIGIVTLTFILIKKLDNFVEVLSILGVFAASSFKLLPSINRILGSFNIFKFSKPSVDSIYEELNSNKIDKEKDNAKIGNFKEKIEFKNVNFKYEKRESLAIENLNLEIKKGDKVIISGETGSGKSTLVDLILGLQKPTKGEIYIDNNKLTSTSKSWLRQIGYVPQSVYLFDDSIIENIILSEDSKNIDNLWLDKILKISQLNNFVNNLPNKLNTIVGEKGYNLSGGQKQRIGIARALYKNPSVLIFDESTNSLDAETETKLIEDLLSELKNITFIMISHKASLKKYFNKFINK